MELKLNSDILLEIFTRLNMNELSKCRLLSRECNSLTYGSSFMRLHCQRSQTIAGYFVQSLNYTKYRSSFVPIPIDNNPNRNPQQRLSLNFLPDAYKCNFKILATVDQGLVFCHRRHPDVYYICKPSTKEWEAVPTPNPATSTTNFGITVLSWDPLRFKIIRISEYSHNPPNNLRYKIIQISEDSDNVPWCKKFGLSDFFNEDDQPNDSDSDSDDLEEDEEEDWMKRVIWREYQPYHVELFDSTTWSWKQLNDVMLQYLEFIKTKNAISACGGLHWLTIKGKNHKILSFYEDEESWEFVTLPDSFDLDQCHSVSLTGYQGKLALMCERSRPNFNIVDLWVMKDHFGERLWSKTHTVDLNAFEDYSPKSFCNADTLFMTSSYRAIFYNVKNGKFDKQELGHKLGSFFDSAFFFQTDYEPIQLRQINTRKHSVFKHLTISPEFIVLGAFFLVYMLLYFLDV